MVDPIRLPGDAATERAGLARNLREAICGHRKDALSVLRQIPAFLSAVEKLASDGNRYRVLVSEQNLHLLREGADGITKPWLRDATGRFVENVDLIRLPPDIAGGLATVAVQAALTELSVKLNAVIRGVDNLAVIIREANRGSLQGAIDALAIARQLRDDRERRTQMLMACGQLVTEIGKVAGQMRAHVAQMPSPETGFWDGWDGDGLAEAAKARAIVHQDFAVLAEGLRRVVGAYFELREFDAAWDAFSRVCARLMDAGLQTAADRARLLPYPEGGPGPEHVFEAFIAAAPLAEARLRLLAAREAPEPDFDFECGEVRQ